MWRLEKSSSLRMQSEEDVFSCRIYTFTDVDGFRLRDRCDCLVSIDSDLQIFTTSFRCGLHVSAHRLTYAKSNRSLIPVNLWNISSFNYLRRPKGPKQLFPLAVREMPRLLKRPSRACAVFIDKSRHHAIKKSYKFLNYFFGTNLVLYPAKFVGVRSLA